MKRLYRVCDWWGYGQEEEEDGCNATVNKNSRSLCTESLQDRVICVVRCSIFVQCDFCVPIEMCVAVAGRISRDTRAVVVRNRLY
jgi:hypothetical protein